MKLSKFFDQPTRQRVIDGVVITVIGGPCIIIGGLTGMFGGLAYQYEPDVDYPKVLTTACLEGHDMLNRSLTLPQRGAACTGQLGAYVGAALARM